MSLNCAHALESLNTVPGANFTFVQFSRLARLGLLLLDLWPCSSFRCWRKSVAMPGDAEVPAVCSVGANHAIMDHNSLPDVRPFVHLSIHLSPQVSTGSMIIGVHRSNSAAVPTIAGCKQDVVQLWTLLSLLLPSKRRKNVHFNFFCVNFFSHTITNLNRRSSSRR